MNPPILNKIEPICGENIVDKIIKKSCVNIISVESGDAFEKAIILSLASHGYENPDAIWGKIISDCISFSKLRKTIIVDNFISEYKKFKHAGRDINDSPRVNNFFQVDMGKMDFLVGKEFIFCDVPEDSYFPTGFTIMEFYRFDELGNERLSFSETTFLFGGSGPIPLIFRAATAAGLLRLIKKHYVDTENLAINIIDSNLTGDYETDQIAEVHRGRLKMAALSNKEMLRCLHCGRYLHSEGYTVELGPLNEPSIGNIHPECIKPSDRVLGTIQLPFFHDYPELMNFDVKSWMAAAMNGQMGLPSDGFAGAYIGWGGLTPRDANGKYLVAFKLKDGTEEIACRRNNLECLTKSEAEEMVLTVNCMIQAKKYKKNPFCYTEQSKIFGDRATLLATVGGKERLIPVEKAYVRLYEERLVQRYNRPGSWYAPLFYLRNYETSEIIVVEESIVFILSDPLEFKNYLSNWADVNFNMPAYEVTCLLSDNAFDEFMRLVVSNGWSAILNPIFDPSNKQLVSGFPVYPIEFLYKIYRNIE